MVTAAAFSAGTTAFQFLSRRHPAQFKGLGQVRIDRFLHMVHGFLGVDKPFRDWVAQKGVAFGVKGGNFRLGQFQPLVLLVVQMTAPFIQTVVLLLGFGIGHEGINLLADGSELRLLHDGLAQFSRFLEDRILSLNICFHSIIDIGTPRSGGAIQIARFPGLAPAIICPNRR